MVVDSEARKRAPRARAMKQLDRDGPGGTAIDTIKHAIKHAARQSYGLIWISFVQIIDPDFVLLLAFRSVATRNTCRGRAAETLKGWPAQIDEYYCYRSTTWRIDQFDLNRKSRRNTSVSSAGSPPAAIATIPEWRLLNLNASRLQPAEP